MDKKGDFRRQVKAVSDQLAPSRGEHPSGEDLIRYQHGQLGAGERQTIQAHLVSCDDCLAAFKDVCDFFEPTREGEAPLADVDVGREWKDFQRQVRAEERAAAGASGRRLGDWWRSPRAVPSALAASLILAMVVIGGGALWLRQERQQLAKQWQAMQAGQTERLQQLEQENRRLQEQARASRQHYESQLAELRQPQLNIPLYDVLSRAALERAGGAREVTRVKVPRQTRSLALILNGEELPNYPSYGIEITDRNDQMIWRGEGLQRGSGGNFVIMLHRAFLPEGQYRLKLYGQTGGRTGRSTEYLIRLEVSD